MIEIKDAILSIGGHNVLNKVSLTARDGQLTAVCGGNGSGNTRQAAANHDQIVFFHGGHLRFYCNTPNSPRLVFRKHTLVQKILFCYDYQKIVCFIQSAKG